jgi:Domain of unknown function (DUF1772)
MSVSSSTTKWSAIIGTAFAGITTGALTFVSAVDVRTFLKHIEKSSGDDDRDDSDNNNKNKQPNVELIRQHFPIWWPYGRDLMVPVILGCVLSNIWAYTRTKDKRFVMTALLGGLIGPYTSVVLGEDIETLRNAQPSDVETTTRHFCQFHHVRLISAAVGFGLALSALADL